MRSRKLLSKQMNSDHVIQEIIEFFHSSRNIHEKKQLKSIMDLVRDFGFHSEQIYASYGEDSAAIRLASHPSHLILVTTDAIIPEFIRATPWGAGFSSIYVGIDDIMACGGVPIAATITISYNDEEVGKEILRGVLEATNRFKIPLIRGHTTTDSPTLSLTSTIIGETIFDEYLSHKNIHPGDSIFIAWDPDGQFAKVNKMFWNTITHKTGDVFYNKRKFIKTLIRKNALSCCKDISMGGVLGTLYQLLEVRGLGASLDLSEVIKNPTIEKTGYSVKEFLFAYLTSAFIVIGKKEKEDLIRKEIESSGMAQFKFGSIIDKKEIQILSLEKKKGSKALDSSPQALDDSKYFKLIQYS